MSDNKKDSFDVRQFIKDNEAAGGPELSAYLDSLGILTIGYGHKITPASPKDVRSLKEGDTISAERAESLFEEDFKYHADKVSKMPGFDKAPPLQKAAVIDLAFNMGPSFYKDRVDPITGTKIKGFTKFADAFARGDYEEAALELKRGSNASSVSRYYTQTGKRPERVMSLLRSKEPEDALTSRIVSLIQRAKKAGVTAKDLASTLKTNVETAYNLLQFPDVSVDRPDVTLTDLMAQSKPSMPSIDIPSAGSPTAYNPYAQTIDLGTERPEQIKSLPAEINDMVQKAIELRTPKIDEDPEFKSTLPQEVIDLIDAERERKNKKALGFAREFAAGATLETADELEAFIAAKEKGTSYSVEKSRINKERRDYTYLNPGASAGAEALGILPGAALSSLAMTRVGITSIPAQSTIDAGTYGFMSGESVEERLLYGTTGAVAGYATGRVVDSLFGPSKAADAQGLYNKQTNDLQAALSSEKIVVRPDAQLTDDEVVDQLIIRETEFLAEALGRQGVDPNQLGNFNIRLLTFGSDMGVPNRQLNKIVSKNKRIKQLRKDSTRGFVDIDDLNAYRRDLLDNVAGRFALDVNRSIPAAQDTIVKLRRLGSPLATLAETVVGKAFADRIVRGMNRVVRGQSELDHIWKGMEDLRTLADDVTFNDMMLDAVNAQRLGAKAAQSALNRAKAYANKKIGEGAGDRLQRFLDDNVEFNKRYRRDVTKGPLSDIWMHSAVKSSDDDVSLRVNRARAASKAEDDASKARKRKAMEKERAKPEEQQLEYVNIFDSHWRWQRETLTRMELGKQLGLRTSGAPLVAPNLKDLPKNLRKKVEAGEMTALEALAKVESDSFKLFDEKIIREALEAEGLSDIQIKNAIEILDDLGVNANRGMTQELEIVRSLGYVGTIANPYGALMNVHDLFNASFELGVGNVLKAVFSRNGIKFSAEDVGLGQQVFGDFVRRANKGDPTLGSPFIQRVAQASEDLLRWSMGASGFSRLDRFGKSRIMGASFNKAKQDIRSGNFDEKWKHSFSRGELDQLKRDIAANNVDSELVRDLVMFDLFRLQPINAAAQTSFGLANPNARLFYMLKGFAIKQFDLMERRIIREWRQGNKKEALNNAMKYLVLSGGGYGVVNEARQVIKGEAPDPKEAAYGAFYQIGSVLTLGAMGANDYGYAKFMEDPLHATVMNFMPPVGATLPAAALEDIADAVRKGDLIPDETIEALPIVGKTIKGTGILD